MAYAIFQVNDFNRATFRRTWKPQSQRKIWKLATIKWNKKERGGLLN